MRKLLALLLIPLMCLVNVPVAALAAESAPKVETEIVHKPAKEVAAGERVVLEAKVKDPQGVDVARAYFKSTQGDNFLFVVMEKVDDDEYRGVLPAPASGAESIEYLFLVKNGADQVVKTQNYRVYVKDRDVDPAAVADRGEIRVFTELENAPQQIAGFSDNLTVDVIESAYKFGYVAGIYQGMGSSGIT